jgi:hypothetical protein
MRRIERFLHPRLVAYLTPYSVPVMPWRAALSPSKAVCLIAGLLSTAACSHTPVAVCPSIVSYTQGEQTQAADELDALPDGSILPRFMTDYGVLRARLRACQ